MRAKVLLGQNGEYRFASGGPLEQEQMEDEAD